MTPHDFTGAPCRDQPHLWRELPHWADHELAANQCRTVCPHLAACQQLLQREIDSSYGRPTGTWAGRLFDEAGEVTEPRIKGRPRKKTA